MASAGNRLGVPPPKNTLCKVRPQASGRSWSRSASSAPTYCVNGGVPPAPRNSCELKSQYGHLRTHQGKWPSRERGGGGRLGGCVGEPTGGEWNAGKPGAGEVRVKRYER